MLAFNVTSQGSYLHFRGLLSSYRRKDSSSKTMEKLEIGAHTVEDAHHADKLDELKQPHPQNSLCGPPLYLLGPAHKR